MNFMYFYLTLVVLPQFLIADRGRLLCGPW